MYVESCRFGLMTKRTSTQFPLSVKHSFDSKAVLRMAHLPSSHTVLLRILDVVMCERTNSSARRSQTRLAEAQSNAQYCTFELFVTSYDTEASLLLVSTVRCPMADGDKVKLLRRSECCCAHSH
jgi:hypothetical protein